MVKTKLASSGVHGIGLFAAEPIKKGREIWKFVQGFDMEFSPATVETLHPIAQQQIKHYAGISRATGNYFLCTDDARFFNHSDTPNVINIPKEGEPEGLDIAARDILEGEELLYDYHVFVHPIPGILW